MSKISATWLGAALLCAFAAVAQATPLTLARGGQPNATIVVPPNAPERILSRAGELAALNFAPFHNRFTLKGVTGGRDRLQITTLIFEVQTAEYTLDIRSRLRSEIAPSMTVKTSDLGLSYRLRGDQ